MVFLYSMIWGGKFLFVFCWNWWYCCPSLIKLPFHKIFKKWTSSWPVSSDRVYQLGAKHNKSKTKFIYIYVCINNVLYDNKTGHDEVHFLNILWKGSLNSDGQQFHHGQATGILYHWRLRVECTIFCNLQSCARTYAGINNVLYDNKTGHDEVHFLNILWKGSLNSDGQQFHQFQQNTNKNVPPQIIEYYCVHFKSKILREKSSLF
jgi:hypothetical protein